MSDFREMNDVRDLEPVEMAGVEGGLQVGDGYCGTPVFHGPLPIPRLPLPFWPVVNVPVIPPIVAVSTG